MKLNFVIFAYRNLFFKKNYGVAVRDLQIIEIIKGSMHTGNVLIVDRPVSVYERAFGLFEKDDSYLDFFSLDFLGPLKRRGWASSCYHDVHEKIAPIIEGWENLVILDFTPLGNIPLDKIKHDFYWYDLIDNFTKHNRFSSRQKKAVREKYESVDRSADLVTAVSDKALEGFLSKKKLTLPNGYYPGGGMGGVEGMGGASYKYGFVGFVTDKFDVGFVRSLSEVDPNFSFVLYGKFFDKKIMRALKAIKGVSVKGAFKIDEVRALISSFKVGLIPYIKSKSHDESPLKLYEYMAAGRLVLTSLDYEVKNDYILNYEGKDLALLVERVNYMISQDGVVDDVRCKLTKELYLDFRVSKAIESVVCSIKRRL